MIERQILTVHKPESGEIKRLVQRKITVVVASVIYVKQYQF